jgi:hypothetical protein
LIGMWRQRILAQISTEGEKFYQRHGQTAILDRVWGQ